MRKRWLVGLLMAWSMALLTGCVRDVHFGEHSPYSVSVKYDQTLVIVLPDNADDMYSEVKIKEGVIGRKFHIHFGEAVRHEARARFAQMFREVAVVTESEYALATGQEIEKPTADPDEPTDEEKFAELKKVKGYEHTPSDVDLLPDFVRRQTGYLLKLQNPLYKFDNGHSTVVLDMEFHDRFLDALLTEGRLRGRGSGVSPHESDSMITKALQESTTSAYSTLFLHLRDQMVAAIEQPENVGAN